MRICDLGLELDGTALGRRVEQLHKELERAGLRFRPHVWLSTGWFTPDGVPGFAVPFYLAHPRLSRIEHRHMLEVEGGTHAWCMKLLRHECGHAIDNAYRLHWRKRWREAFGSFAQPYRMTYQPRPNSRNYVHNLDGWYSQSHPAEDWAECFAVWLRPNSGWRRRYAGWPVMTKLQFVDEIMGEVRDQPRKVRSRRREDPASSVQETLGDYYDRKREAYAVHHEGAFDADLRRLFSTDQSLTHRPSAVSFLRKHRVELRNHVATMTGQHRYTVDQALREMIAGCRRQGLRVARSRAQSQSGAAVLLTVLTLSMLRGKAAEFSR